MRRCFSFFLFLVLVYSVQLLSTYAIGLTVGEWYYKYVQPYVEYRSWPIPPLWLLLYATVAASGWKVFVATSGIDRIVPMALFFLILFFHLLWFYLSPEKALIDLFLLWALLLYTMALYWVVSREATILLLPYFGWITFVTSLNLLIYFNRITAAP